MRNACTRGFIAKSALHSLDRFAGPPGREKIGAKTVAEIETAGMLSWVPTQHYSTIVLAAHGLLPIAQYRAFMGAIGTKVGEEPMLKGGLNFNLGSLGVSPRTLIKATAMIWKITSQDCGTLEVRDPEGPKADTLELVWNDIPPESMHPVVLEAALGVSMENTFTRCGCVGQIKVAPDLPNHSATYSYQWYKRTKPTT